MALEKAASAILADAVAALQHKWPPDPLFEDRLQLLLHCAPRPGQRQQLRRAQYMIAATVSTSMACRVILPAV